MVISLRLPQAPANIHVILSDTRALNQTIPGPITRILDPEKPSQNHEQSIRRTSLSPNPEILEGVAHTSNIPEDSLSTPLMPFRSTLSVDEYLRSTFAHEARILALLLNPCFGTAYQHYTRYMILSHICVMTGLDIH